MGRVFSKNWEIAKSSGVSLHPQGASYEVVFGPGSLQDKVLHRAKTEPGPAQRMQTSARTRTLVATWSTVPRSTRQEQPSRSALRCLRAWLECMHGCVRRCARHLENGCTGSLVHRTEQTHLNPMAPEGDEASYPESGSGCLS